ncbi:MAG: aldo/keto reductase [Acidobacteria bacterium]|nr:aldo/keto reductase [Acidobacteriota bacterium]
MLSRRQILQILGSATVIQAGPALAAQASLTRRTLGRTGRWVVPFGLGGQASLQYPGTGVDVADIVVRAVESGVNYLDTANAYGPSQSIHGQAIWRMRLTPGHAEYDAVLRQSLYYATKTGQRYALDRSRPNASTAVSDLMRSLTVMFGDGKGWIPDGAYLDAIQIHNMTNMTEVDQIWEGFDQRGSRMPDRIGALAGLLDFRDGTNFTGLNPEGRHYIRHIGVTGHLSSRVLMSAIQRDRADILDTVLVALNANDRQYSSHQFNVVPLARAKGMGIIAMKVFSAGGIYTGLQRQPSNTSELIRTVGVPGGVASEDLIRYPLSVPGVSVVIAGVGAIDRERPEQDQLLANLAASQMDATSAAEHSRIEDDVRQQHGARTNYFQERQNGLIQPPAPVVERDGERAVIRWTNAFAGVDPIRAYNVYAGDTRLASLPWRPQLTASPLELSVPAELIGEGALRVEASTEWPVP